MKKPYQTPSFHLLPGIPDKSGEELAAMSNEELEACLMDNGFAEASRCYCANPDYLLREVAGEALLIPTGGSAGNMMMPLSETAAFLWQLLQQKKTMQDIICAAKAEYADENSIIETHIYEFINEHLKTGLILEGK